VHHAKDAFTMNKPLLLARSIGSEMADHKSGRVIGVDQNVIGCRPAGEPAIRTAGHHVDLVTPPRRGLSRSVASAAFAIVCFCQSGVARHAKAIGAFFAILTLACGGFGIWDMHRRTIEDATGAMRDLGLVLAEQASRSIQVIDVLLQDLQLRSRDLGVQTPDRFGDILAREDTHRFLVERMKNLPQVRSIGVFDADGIQVNTSTTHGLKNFSVTDRDYFQYLRENPDGGIVVGAPNKGHGSGIMSVYLARRLSGPDGSFLGVVVAALNLDYLLDFYQAISRGQRLAVTLLRHDGLVLTRYPAVASIGQPISTESPWYKTVAAGGGTYPSPGYLTTKPAIVAVTPLRDYPLVIDVSTHDDDVLANWGRQASYIMGGAIILAGMFISLFWVVAQQIRRQEDHNTALTSTADALRGSESRLRTFVELASDWFWEQDADLRFTEVGLGAPFRLASDRSHVGKRRWEINDTIRDSQRWEKHQLDLMNHQRFVDFRFDRIGADGALRHVSISGVPVHDGSGLFTGYRGIGRDITAEVHVENELREAKNRAEQAENLLKDAVDSMSEGFVIYDSEDRLTLCNDAYLRLYPADAPLIKPGVKYEDLVRNSLNTGQYPDAAGREEEEFAKFMHAHQTPDSDIEAHVRDGKWVLMTERRMRNGGTAGLRINITALKQTKAALLESEMHLDRAQAIAGIGSWELNVATGRYTWSKQLYHIRGLSPADFEPNIDNVALYVHADDYPSIRRWVAELVDDRAENSREVRIVRPDGKVRLLRVEGRAVRDLDGVIRRLAGTMQDITEVRLIERQLAQSQKMEAIGNLTGGMAHDFNNVLGIIVGNLDLLQPLVRADAAAAELCDEALDGATRCADLIRRLLAFARRQSLRPERTDVNGLVSEIVRLLGRTLGENITLRLDLDAAVPPVMVDPAQLEAALVNLATNARDAMPKGGRLDIVTRKAHLDESYTALHPDVGPGDYTLIEVSDIGDGIPPEIIGRIFEPFFTTKDIGKGSGLGLSMAFGFVRQSGGHLSVYSEPGLGTTFRLYLPPCVAVERAPAGVPVKSTVIGGHETVLVVEDNTQLRRAATRQLSELGYRVREAEHGAAALDILTSQDRVDLLFTDLVMPGGIDGLDLAYHAARLRRGLKVLMTSGFPDVRGANEHMLDCPFTLLNKPYRRDELARTVREILDGDDGRGSDCAAVSEEV
jgi:PAS domain S-box-containing protein